jgi:hypothetical protein
MLKKLASPACSPAVAASVRLFSAPENLAANSEERRSDTWVVSLLQANETYRGPGMGARNQVGIGLLYRPASLCSLATQFQTRFLELIPRPIAGLKFPTLFSLRGGVRGGGGGMIFTLKEATKGISTYAGAAQQQATVNSSYVISTWVQTHHTSSLKSHQSTKVDALVNVCRLFESAFKKS